MSRTAALSGLAGIALLDVGWFWDPTPPIDWSAPHLASYFAAHRPDRRRRREGVRPHRAGLRRLLFRLPVHGPDLRRRRAPAADLPVLVLGHLRRLRPVQHGLRRRADRRGLRRGLPEPRSV